MAKLTEIENLIQPVIEAMGFELWGCELHSSGRYTILRVFIESSEKGGVNIDDCGNVSHQIGALLDVENPITGNYSLEVSSPGIERALYKLKHYERYIGSLVRVTLLKAENGKKNFTGCIRNVSGEVISLLVDNEMVEISFSNIVKANLMAKHKGERI